MMSRGLWGGDVRKMFGGCFGRSLAVDLGGVWTMIGRCLADAGRCVLGSCLEVVGQLLGG